MLITEIRPTESRQAGWALIVANGIEVATFQSLDSQSGDGVRLIHQAAKCANATFARFKEQQASLFTGTYSFCAQFGLFELEELLHATLESVLEGGLNSEIGMEFRAEQAHQKEILGGLGRQL